MLYMIIWFKTWLQCQGLGYTDKVGNEVMMRAWVLYRFRVVVRAPLELVFLNK